MIFAVLNDDWSARDSSPVKDGRRGFQRELEQPSCFDIMNHAKSHTQVVHQWMFGTSFPLAHILFSNQHNSLREHLDSDKDNDFLGQSINDCAEAARTNTMNTFLPSLSDLHP